jgi:hypothetical protein
MKKVKYYISLTLVLIMIFSVFSGCNSTAPGETTADGRGTNGTGTTSATSDPADTGTVQVTGEQDTGTGGPDTGEQTEPPVQAKRDSWDADYLLELQDRVEADYRNRGEVSRELGISPNEEFLNRRFYNMNRLDMMQVHDDINRLTIRYLELELDDSLFLPAPEGWTSLTEEIIFVYPGADDKGEKDAVQGSVAPGDPEAVIRLEEFKVYFGDSLSQSYRGLNNPDPAKYKHESSHHCVTLELRLTGDRTEKQREYQKKIIRYDDFDEITPIEFRFLFDDCMVYHTYYRNYKIQEEIPYGFFLFYDMYKLNLYGGFLLRAYLLKEVYGAPDENGRYGLPQKEDVASFN